MAQGPWTAKVDVDPAKPWAGFMQYVKQLNAQAPPNVQYKFIINGRHGEGWHNVAEMKVGTPAWEDHYSKLLEIDGHTMTDAELTPNGQEQARLAGAFLNRLIQERGLPPPESYVVSPLHRCQQTSHLEWLNVQLPADRPFKPLVKEMIREILGVHRCDKRSTRTVLVKDFPDVKVEDGFSEDDLLWTPDHRETFDEQDVRTQGLLDDVFSHDPATFISFTSHAGSIASVLRVISHRLFPMQTGGLIPLLIKATKLE